MTKKLPERWWRDRDLLQAEVKEHGSLAEAARAHGAKANLLRKAWSDFGLPKLPSHAAPPAAEEVSREEVLEQEVRELRFAVRKQRQAEVYDERSLALLQEQLERKQPEHKPPAPALKLAGTQTEHEFLLPWSDLHGAERVSLEQTNGLNEYGWDIMVARHWLLREKILSFKEHRPYPIRRLTIAPLGDMVSGDIHDELRETNEKVLMEAAVDLGYFAADWIESFASEFETIVVDGCVTGNHGRRHRKPQAKNVHDSFDWLVYEIIRLRLERYQHISVRVRKSAHAFMEVAGRKIMCFHGDGVRTTMPGVPWGGIIRRCKEFQQQYERTHGWIDHFLLGHWHEPQVVSNRRIVVNGSIKGPDEFTIKLGAAEASQVLLTFHPHRGMTDVSFLDLQGEK